MSNYRQRASRVAAASALIVLSALFAPALAGAQEDPYGTTETTAPPAVEGIVCQFDLEAAAAGTVVTATVSGRFAESGDVNITFNGEVVASEPVQGGATEQEVTLRFSVPNLPPGTYDVSATGPGFTEPCGRGTFTITGGTGVNQGGSGGGSLARTGAELAPWVLAGLALLGVGAYLVRQSRRRQHLA